MLNYVYPFIKYSFSPFAYQKDGYCYRILQCVIQVKPQDMADSFQPPFKTCVEEGKATSLMCAYSRLNGVSNCANYDLLTTTARGQWGFNG